MQQHWAQPIPRVIEALVFSGRLPKRQYRRRNGVARQWTVQKMRRFLIELAYRGPGASYMSKLGQTNQSRNITRCNMALPLPPGLTPPEIAFLCEMELVTVIPRQRLEGLELLGVGVPLQTPRHDQSHTRIVYNLTVLMIIRDP